MKQLVNMFPNFAEQLVRFDLVREQLDPASNDRFSDTTPRQEE